MHPTLLAEPPARRAAVPANPCTVLLPTMGSMGDVHPVLAVARRLRDQGHRPVVITSAWFEPHCREAGIEFETLLEWSAFEHTARNPDIWHPWRGFRVLSEGVIVPAMRPLFEIVERWANRGDDLVIASSILCLGARLAHEKLGIPQATLLVQPVTLRTRFDRVGTPHLNYPRGGAKWLKDLAFAMADAAIADPALCPELNAYRAWLGLPRIRRPLDGWIHSDQLVVGLWPEWYAPVQPDWPRRVELTDFPYFDPGDELPLSPDVEDYLLSGPPPIVFTGGSANVHTHALFDVATETCRRLGARGILLTPEIETFERVDGPVRPFRFINLEHLLPRARAIVHHGGIGTTSRALRAGLPQVVLPHSHDQPDNAVRVKALGAGDYIPSTKLSTDRLVAVLRRELDRDRPSPALRSRDAGALDGPGAAARAITRLARTARV